MSLARMGEFGMIDRIAEIVGSHPGKAVLGIGDDAALIESRSGLYTILTTDALVEGIHFDPAYTPFNALGWKAIAVSISDVAAMGGIPVYAVVTMGVPAHWQVQDIEYLYQGMVSCCSTYHCEIVGGDTVGCGSNGFLSVTVIGEVEKENCRKRDGAAIGDRLCVTGKLGASRTGLEILRSGADGKNYANAIDRFLRPKPRIDVVTALSGISGITAMIDISDGLGSEIHHLCKQSELDCVIQETSIPVAPDAEKWCRFKQIATTPFVIESGEEYELLFTVDNRVINKKLRQTFNELEICIIGEMTKKESGPRIQNGDTFSPLHFQGWDHFKE